MRQLDHWVKRESKRWGSFTRHGRENIVVFSRGVARAQSSQIRRIAGYAGGKADSQRRRLQRFLGQGHDLKAFFVDWTRSVLKHVQAREVVLAVDETKLKAALA